MLKKSIFLLVIFILISAYFTQPLYAQTCPGPNCNPNPFGGTANTINLGNQLGNSGLGVQPPTQGGIVGTIIKNTISILFIVGGIGTLAYFVWGAVDWIMSGGDKEKVSNARKKMTHAIIGLVLLSLSYFIISLVGDIFGFNPLQPLQIKSLGEQ